MKWLGRAAAALLAVFLAPAACWTATGRDRPAAEKVVVLPVQTLDADPGNGERMTEALAANLSQHGSQVVAIPEVRKAMADLGYALDRPVFLPAMTKIARQVGAEFVIYARVLVQGPTANADSVL